MLDARRYDRHTPTMLLYDAPNPAPNPRRVRIALAEKGISIPIKPVSIIAREHKADDFVERYPPGQVPVLELDDGRMLGESISICRYIEALHPQPALFGTDPASAAFIDMMIRRVEFTLMMPVGMVWVHDHPLTARVVKHQYKDFGASNRERVADAMRTLDQGLASGFGGAAQWLAGDSYSMADIVLLTTIDFAAFVGMAMPDDVPALADWHARASARPSASA